MDYLWYEATKARYREFLSNITNQVNKNLIWRHKVSENMIYYLIVILNKAKAISAKLLELNFKNKLEEMGKTRWNRKKKKN